MNVTKDVYENMNLAIEESSFLTINGEAPSLEIKIYDYDYNDYNSVDLGKEEVKQLIYALQHWVNDKPV